MNNDLQRCYQPNLGKGMASMVFVAFAFALLVNSLGAPEAEVTVYKGRSFITAYPFDRKIRIEGGGKSGNKIGISGTVEAQSGAGEDTSLNVSHEGIQLKASALSAFESRLNHWGNVSIRLIDSRGIVDSTMRVEPLAVLIQRRL